MRIIFGDYKVKITAGLTKDNNGVVVLQKLLHVGDLESAYDISVDLTFKTPESIDTLMTALQYAREKMYETK